MINYSEQTETQLELVTQLIKEIDPKGTIMAMLEEEYDDVDIDWKKLSFTYLGEPKAQTRPRATRAGGGIRMYDQSADIKATLSNAIIMQLGENFRPLTGSLSFELRFYRSYPKSFSKKKRILAEMGLIRPEKKPDIDNYEKLVYDALKGILYHDDGLVVKSVSEKFYSIKPRVEITVWYHDGFNIS